MNTSLYKTRLQSINNSIMTKSRLFIHPFLNQIKKLELVTALREGARLRGYASEIAAKLPEFPVKDDILVIWNRHLTQQIYAKHFEFVGAKVLVFENPYLKSKINPELEYSMGLSFHNNWNYSLPTYDEKKWKTFYSDYELKEWKKYSGDPKTILICTQAKVFNGSGLGYEGYKQPAGWDLMIIEKVRAKYPDALIIFRTHPKARDLSDARKLKKIKNFEVSDGKFTSIDYDLTRSDCVITYTSNAATESILNGNATFITGPTTFLKSWQSGHGFTTLHNAKFVPNRIEGFKRLVCNQFFLSDISSGKLFDILSGIS